MQKLFSSLSSKKKDEVFINSIDLLTNTIELSRGLRDEIRSQIELDVFISYRKIFDEMTKKQYVFIYKDLIFTTNIVEIMKKMKDNIPHTEKKIALLKRFNI